jgi:predicted phosphodiesterase
VSDGAVTEWWRDPQKLQETVDLHGSFAATSRATGISDSTIKTAWTNLGLPPRGKSQKAKVSEPAASEQDEAVLKTVKKLGVGGSVDAVADICDLSPKRVRESLERLGHAGYRIEEDAGQVALHKIARPTEFEHKVLFDGDVYRFAICSDAHLNSKHCRLDELHIAYDRIAAEGISDVYNPGDIISGRGIYKGQDHEILNFTYGKQVEYAVQNYPERPGVTTYIISGNHDCEGDFGRAGADGCLGVANQRDDIEWCGRYAADFTLPNGAVLTMRHPMGGSSYASSYKPQKFAGSFEGGYKPNILLFGHWHNMLFMIERNIFILNCGTFEGFGGSLGLRVPLGAPAVGFFIVEATLAEDGSVVQFTPTWHPFFAGRRAS